MSGTLATVRLQYHTVHTLGSHSAIWPDIRVLRADTCCKIAIALIDRSMIAIAV